MSATRINVQRASTSMSHLAMSIKEINRLHAETADLIRTIDECGFNTRRGESDSDCTSDRTASRYR